MEALTCWASQKVLESREYGHLDRIENVVVSITASVINNEDELVMTIIADGITQQGTTVGISYICDQDASFHVNDILLEILEATPDETITSN